MFQSHRVIACIPSGRRRFMSAGLPYILSDRCVDEVQCWVNTDVPEDLAYLNELQASFPIVKLIDAGPAIRSAARDGHVQYNDGVSRFYQNCCEPNTVYVKCDDDLVWYCQDFFEKLVGAALSDPPCVFAIANMVNTPHSSYMHDKQGCFGVIHNDVQDYYRCHKTLVDGPFAEFVHNTFIAAIKAGETSKFLYQTHDVGPGHQRIGCTAWKGETFAMFGGKIQGIAGDEADLTIRVPQELGLPIRFCGDALVAHHSFGHQSTFLDATDILEKYQDISIR